MNPTGKPGSNPHTSQTTSSAPKNPAEEMKQFFQSTPFPANPKLVVPFSDQWLTKLKHIEPYDYVWSSRTDKNIPYDTHLTEYFTELTSHNNPGNYVLIGQMGIEPNLNVFHRNAVINFVVVEDHLAYMAQIDWGFDSQKNPLPAQQQLATYFNHFKELQTQLQGKNLPHGKRLVVIESNFIPDQAGCAWISENTEFNYLTNWNQVEKSYDLALELLKRISPAENSKSIQDRNLKHGQKDQ